MKVVARMIALLLLAVPALLTASEIPSRISPQITDIVFDPGVPTARDGLEVRVSGAAPGACSSPTLTPLLLEGNTLRLDLEFDSTPCGPVEAGAGGAFTAEAEVGPLAAGRYAVRLYADGVLRNTAVLQVHRSDAAAGLPGRSGLGMLVVILLLSLAGAALLR